MPAKKIEEARDAFEVVLASRGLSIERLEADDLLEAMLQWYEEYRVEDAMHLDEDGDMLLFQWGTYDTGSGPRFIYDLTRQMIELQESDPPICQVSAILEFESGPDTDELGSGDQWCVPPSDLASFVEFVRNERATSYATGRQPSKRRIAFQPAD